MGASRREPAAPPREPDAPAPVLRPAPGAPRPADGEPEAGDGLSPDSYALPPRCGGRRVLGLGLVAALGFNLFALAMTLARRPAALSRSEALLAAATLASSAVLLVLMQIGRWGRRSKRPSS